MIVACSIEKCPYRYEKVTVCSYYYDGICEIMSDEEEDCVVCEHHECFDCPKHVNDDL